MTSISCIIILLSAFMKDSLELIGIGYTRTYFSYMYNMFQAEWMAPEVLRNELSDEK